jgi:hypothetical protein
MRNPSAASEFLFLNEESIHMGLYERNERFRLPKV